MTRRSVQWAERVVVGVAALALVLAAVARPGGERPAPAPAPEIGLAGLGMRPIDVDLSGLDSGFPALGVDRTSMARGAGETLAPGEPGGCGVFPAIPSDDFATVAVRCIRVTPGRGPEPAAEGG